MPAGNYQGTYAAEKVIVTYGGVIITGFGDSDFITVKYRDDRYMDYVGADGEVGRSKNASRVGDIEITLSATSEANDQLSAVFNLSQLGGIDAPLPFGVADLSGRSFAGASKAWLKTAPDLTFGKEITDRVWALTAADLVINFGGNN